MLDFLVLAFSFRTCAAWHNDIVRSSGRRWTGGDRPAFPSGRPAGQATPGTEDIRNVHCSATLAGIRQRRAAEPWIPGALICHDIAVKLGKPLGSGSAANQGRTFSVLIIIIIPANHVRLFGEPRPTGVRLDRRGASSTNVGSSHGCHAAFRSTRSNAPGCSLTEIGVNIPGNTLLSTCTAALTLRNNTRLQRVELTGAADDFPSVKSLI